MDSERDKLTEGGAGNGTQQPKKGAPFERKVAPVERVRTIIDSLGQSEDHKPKPVFTELQELQISDKTDDWEWRETARWVKFEEVVEIGGNRWSKPHVGALTFPSVFELRGLIDDCVLCMDMEGKNFEQIIENCLSAAVSAGKLRSDRKESVRKILLKPHRHQYQNEETKPMMRSFTGLKKNKNGDEENDEENATEESKLIRRKTNLNLMKKLENTSEALNILVGQASTLDDQLCIFIRLKEGVVLGELTEVAIPSRFIFILIGPAKMSQNMGKQYKEVGRCLATVMVSDKLFHEVSYKTSEREHLVAAMDKFLDDTTVLPRGEWDPSIRIEPPDVVPVENDGSEDIPPEALLNEQDLMKRDRERSGLFRTGRPFGGLIADIKRKLPWYKSDFVDALNFQCLASFIFLYVAVLAPLITFGGLFAGATGNKISVIETLLGGCLVGVVFGFLSGQPLTILGPTGPILVFETIMYEMCKTYDLEYLALRFWIGMWVGVILLICVVTDASALVCVITRFTEENFAFLIAIIFIKEAFSKVWKIQNAYPMNPSECLCVPKNETVLDLYGSSNTFTPLPEESARLSACEFESNGISLGGFQSPGCHYVPNVFMTCVVLFAGTYILTKLFKQFKTSTYLTATIRGMVSDFAVILALIAMTVVDFFLKVETPKLDVPITGKIEPSWSGRGWVVDPFNGNPWWTCLAAFVPAVLATILVFMDHQITVVIVNRKENKLRKGCGYHLDLFIVAVMIMICSVFGFPWCEGSTVPSIIHVKSLMRESKTAAPGEKAQFLGIYEQRVTHILVFLFVGISIFLAPMLVLIPMPVLFGVFLFMGMSSLDGLQFWDRINLFFMPAKHQPDMPYLRRVPLKRIHLFTILQLLCFTILWVVKVLSLTRILFPVMLVVLIGVRRCLSFIFTEEELKILDDVLPSFRRTQQLDIEDKQKRPIALAFALSDIVSLRVSKGGELELPMANGNVMKIPVDDINLPGRADDAGGAGHARNRHGSSHKSSNDEPRRNDSNV